MSRLVVTGAAGFVGRRLLERLASRGDRVTAIGRRGRPEGVPSDVEWVIADLNAPASYEGALEGASCVIHLAALTGKARPADFRRDNVDATAALLGACERAGVPRIVLMSSIAAKFADRRFYPYAESKIAAEKLARDSSLTVTIVRPTMILGPGSPIEAALGKLARLPVVPMFGDGLRRIQPVHVDEVVRALVALADAPAPIAGVVELGGAETLTMRALLARLRGADVADVRFLTLPLGLIRSTLAVLEGPLLPVLPLTAGQLASFANDSVADPHPALERLLAGTEPGASAPASATPVRASRDGDPPPSAPAQRGPSAGGAPTARLVDEAALAREMRRYARYLVGVEPTPYQVGKYLELHRQRSLDPRNGLDALLLRVSRWGWPGLALADAYGGTLYRTNVLRAKLMLALALLECAPPSFQKLDAPDPGGPGLVNLGLGARLAGAALALVLSAALFAPAHLVLGLTGGLGARPTARA